MLVVILTTTISPLDGIIGKPTQNQIMFTTLYMQVRSSKDITTKSHVEIEKKYILTNIKIIEFLKRNWVFLYTILKDCTSID